MLGTKFASAFHRQEEHGVDSNITGLNVRPWGARADGDRAPLTEDAGWRRTCAQSSQPEGKPAVLVPLDFSPASLQAAICGIQVARDSRGLLLLVHAVHLNLTPHGPANPAWLKAGLCREAMTRAEPILTCAQDAGVTAICAVEQGTPAAVIAKVARRWKAKVIIMGIPRRGILGRLFGGRLIEKVIHVAECPVIVLETQRKAHLL